MEVRRADAMGKSSTECKDQVRLGTASAVATAAETGERDSEGKSWVKQMLDATGGPARLLLHGVLACRAESRGRAAG